LSIVHVTYPVTKWNPAFIRDGYYSIIDYTRHLSCRCDTCATWRDSFVIISYTIHSSGDTSLLHIITTHTYALT